MATEREYTAFFPFCGIGGGALGFQAAEVRLLGTHARFRTVGGIDFDRGACLDFERLTGAPALCADIATLTPTELVAFAGATAPDVVFLSPPCKGASGLLSAKKAKGAKYRRMNRLALDWTKTMLAAWGDAPPKLVLLENVPRLKQRAGHMLRGIRLLLKRAGYVFSDGFHDCGEIGGLAQYRRRYLLVARHAGRVPPLLYQPPKKRVRACGEVLSTLPVPGTPAAESAGPLHVLPRLSWLNWVRLALIPAGGDWRDLPGVLEQGQQRRTKFRRHHVQEWQQPSATVAGAGSNGPENVADPRPGSFGNVDRVKRWDEPAGTVTSSPAPSSGAGAVADPRAEGFPGAYGVRGWAEPAATVTGNTAGPSSGAHGVADPRVGFNGTMGVRDWEDPSATITGDARPTKGAFAVADPRVAVQPGNPDAHWNKFRVSDFDEPAGAVMGATRPGSGAPSVADPRVALSENAGRFKDKYRVDGWDGPTGTVVGGASLGSNAKSVADPRARAWFHHVYKVVAWTEPVGTVTGAGKPSSGAASVADPRLKTGFDHGYAVLPWTAPSFTVAAGSHPGQGAYSVADPRVQSEPRAGAYGVIPWSEAAKTVTGSASIDNGPFAVADTRTDEVVMVIRDVRKAPPAVPVIIAADGTWHRPMTTLEMALLQSFPARLPDGSPFTLVGTISRAREKIGNAVPPNAAEAIAERMLVTLVHADLNAFSLSGGLDVWVRRPELRA